MTVTTLDLVRTRRRDVLKRGLDIVTAGLGLVVCAPLFGLIAVLVRLDSPGPVFFRQERPGRDLKPFTMLKFRSMAVGSDAIKPEDFEALGYGPLQKHQADPRVTRVGRLLRRSSLDELPQLINVLRGEMSIVGPRPVLGWEWEHEDLLARAAVAPGITCLWQVSGRSDLSLDERLELDLEYVRRRSLLLDLKIILRTVPAVLFSKGAY
jgi:lipopolysaccharide/colanic/teichoic acid biosynthesis glycosyltransferase